jgi:hypothetical protein
MDFGRTVRRGTVAVLIMAAAGASPAWAAGDGIAATGQRLVAEAVVRDASRDARASAAPSPRGATVVARDAEEQAPGLTRSSMSRGKKLAIGLGLAVAFGAVVYTIDQKVEDNTPSSRGLR